MKAIRNNCTKPDIILYIYCNFIKPLIYRKGGFGILRCRKYHDSRLKKLIMRFVKKLELRSQGLENRKTYAQVRDINMIT